MKQTDIRPLFATPWAEQADSSTIAPIPQSATAIGRASMALGFPKATMTPIAAGGVPPYGEDMNGILNMLSRAAQAAELGMLHPFSADYATAINGYPVGATIAHPTIAGRFLICTADNNTNDPSQSMNGWLDPLAGIVSGSALNGSPYQNDFTVSNIGVNKSSGTPWLYSTGGGGFINLALQSALQQETQRAQAAEAGLLPLTGGTITGPINRAGGGVLPEVIGPGLTGRVVIQAFTATGQIEGGHGGEAWISFPHSFIPGSNPLLAVLLNRELGPATKGYSRFPTLGNLNSENSPNVTNSGFSFQPVFVSGALDETTGEPWTAHVIAIGVMQ